MISPFGIDFLTSTIAVMAMLALGLLIFFKGERSLSSSLFLFFTTVSAFWGTLNYINYQLDDPVLVLWTIRIVMFLAVFQAVSFFLLMYIFPNRTALPKRMIAILGPLVATVAVLTLTPFVFSGIRFVSGGVSQPISAPGIAVFGLFAVSLVISGIYILIKKMLRASGLEKLQFKYLLFGVVTMFPLIIIFNFLLPAIFQNTSFIPLSGIFVLPFIIATTYSILRHRLFDIRVIATELFAALIIILFLFNTLLSENLRDVLTNGLMFIFVTIFGILLVRGTIREIRELQRLSTAKSDFVAIVSHQLRTPLTAIKGFVSMIQEGSGSEEDRKNWLNKAYITNERMIRLVGDILNISRIERGTLQYTFKDTDIVDLIEGVISETRMQAEEKGIVLKWEKPATDVPLIRADEEKLRQVILNLVDNATHYTDTGHINVRLTYLPALARVRIVVQDTGIGMAHEDLKNLFEQFARGSGGKKTNVEGLGLGLYVAQSIVKAHHGKIWAESDGLHKGSRFYVELPVQ